jgi:hypothetical protein
MPSKAATDSGGRSPEKKQSDTTNFTPHGLRYSKMAAFDLKIQFCKKIP